MRPPPSVCLPVLAGLGLLLTSGTAPAGWVSIKNELKIAVVIQELPDNPAVKRGKAVRLLPGETYREYHPVSGEKRFHLLDLRGHGKPLFLGLLRWSKLDVSLRIRSEEGGVTVVPVTPRGADDPAVVTASADRSKP